MEGGRTEEKCEGGRRRVGIREKGKRGKGESDGGRKGGEEGI